MPSLYEALGVYLPLITTNCAVLGVVLQNAQKGYNFHHEPGVRRITGGVGFLLAIVLFASVRERMEFAKCPKCFEGFPIALVAAGLISLAFMGFSGLKVWLREARREYGYYNLAPIAVCVLGIVFGIILAVASKVFAVEKDPREEAITECLPGANCGGCGYPGCGGYASAVVKGLAPVDACAPGGPELAKKIGAIMGVEVGRGRPQRLHRSCVPAAAMTRPAMIMSVWTAAWASPGVLRPPAVFLWLPGRRRLRGSNVSSTPSTSWTAWPRWTKRPAWPATPA